MMNELVIAQDLNVNNSMGQSHWSKFIHSIFRIYIQNYFTELSEKSPLQTNILDLILSIHRL